MSDKPKIDYPLKWSYKIIARNESDIRQAVTQMQHFDEYQLTFSNSSAKGLFTSMEYSTNVKSETERLSIYQQLKTHPSIKMVL